jgi:hypothetical protein
MKAYGGVDILIHVFLISVIVGDEWSVSRLGHFNPEEITPVTRWKGGWMGAGTGLEDVEKRKFLTL